MSVLEEQVLVLNRSWRPIRVTTVRNAVTMVYQETARFVEPESYGAYGCESWKDAVRFAREAVRFVHGAGWKMAVPEVIGLSRHDGLSRQRRRFTRRHVHARGGNTCQYCGQALRTKNRSLDHVVPRSRGGRSTWENVVVACHPYNRRKDNRTPEEAGMRLVRRPGRPRWRVAPVPVTGRSIPASWEAFLSELYWHQELIT